MAIVLPVAITASAFDFQAFGMPRLPHEGISNCDRLFNGYSFDLLFGNNHQCVFCVFDCFLYLEMAVSLQQHAGCSGNAELFHPPPKAWTRSTAFIIRRPRMVTE